MRNVETRASSNYRSMIDEVTTLLEKSYLAARYFLPRFHVCMYVAPRPVLIKRASIDRFCRAYMGSNADGNGNSEVNRDRGETAGWSGSSRSRQMP